MKKDYYQMGADIAMNACTKAEIIMLKKQLSNTPSHQTINIAVIESEIKVLENNLNIHKHSNDKDLHKLSL